MSNVVTCSDASLERAGVVYSRKLTAAGRQGLGRVLRAPADLGDKYWVLVESFTGIAGCRRAAMLVGLRPRAFVAIERDAEAQAVIMYHFPETVLFGDIKTVGKRELSDVASGTPDAIMVLHAGGSPCPGMCRWNPFQEKMAGESHELLGHLRRVTKVIAEVWPRAIIHELEENVQSMTIQDRRGVNKFLGNRPYAFNSSDVRPRRRGRFFWSTWSVTARPGVEVKEQEDLFRVTLVPRRTRPVNSWFDSGWTVREDCDVLPTLT